MGTVVTLTDGLWFTEDQVLFIDEHGAIGPEHGLVMPVIENMGLLMWRHSELREWSASNPPPLRGDPLMWWDQFADECIVRCGWNLLWRGKLFTEGPTITRAAEALRNHQPEAGRLDWPADSTVLVRVFNRSGAADERFAPCADTPAITWRELAHGDSAEQLGDPEEYDA